MVESYVFEQTWESERDRLASLEAVYDGPTRERLAALGVGEGWRCLEVGCGAGSVARWLAERVGGTGRVLAVDLDPRFALGVDVPGLEVRQHDLMADPLPEGAFDLVHARAVVEHIPERDEALRRLVAAARPGGWVVLEDFDVEGPMADAVARYWPSGSEELAGRLFRALEAAFTAAGVDAGYGRRLPEALASAGLVEVAARVHAPLLPGGTAFLGLTLRRLRPRLVGTGLLTDADLDATIELTERQGVMHVPNFMVTAWGRRVG
ncbi:methyltransferase domain-containing protein [Streptacidiphilus anmyonensis]|uniref:methyltransferase domain-containing protein n=1 Tax=Streptacidiphilus anmyonensis TaxID=405782 RepID=UPI0005AB2213|nr:methyltransferase domain-containing protein [Streptacidiphilus anmyonensis]